jgi:hypothetical protein
MVGAMLRHRPRQQGPFIGLEIGTIAVRAAEVKVDGRGATLQRFAQMELPPGRWRHRHRHPASPLSGHARAADPLGRGLTLHLRSAGRGPKPSNNGSLANLRAVVLVT